MDTATLDKYGRERIAKLADPSVPVHFRRGAYRIKKKVQLLGIADMDELMVVLKLIGAECDNHKRIYRMPGTKGKRVPIWTWKGGVDVIQLWEQICNKGKPHESIKDYVVVRH